MDVAGAGLHLPQHRLRHLHVLGHADLAVHVDGLREEPEGLIAVAGGDPALAKALSSLDGP